MSTVSFRVDKTGLDRRAAAVRRIVASGAVSKAGGIELEGAIKDHVAGLAQSRHASATRLGATPTGHMDASRVYLEASDAESATVRVAIPGVRRAFRAVDIVPRRASALTIPIHAWAYGRTVREVRDAGREVFRPKGTSVLATRGENGALVSLYALRKSVHQSQDRTLMPSDAAMSAAFGRGCQLALTHLLRRAG